MFGQSIYVPDNPALIGGSPQAVHEQLWMRGRRRRLQIRGLLAGAALVAGTWLAHLWCGLLLAAIAAAADTAYYWRQRLTSSVWRRGQRGERRTSMILRLTLDRRGYRILQGREIPGHGRLDHLVIGPTGVFLVANEAVAPDSVIVGHRGALFLDQRSGARISRPLREQADATAALLADRLGGEIAVEAVGVMHGGRLTPALIDAEAVTLLRALRLPRWIRSRRIRYTPDEVAAIADAAHRLPISRHAAIVR